MTNLHSYTKSEYLGVLVWYDVSTSAQIPFDKFNDLVIQNNLPIRTMSPPRNADIFRRACANCSVELVDGKYTYTMDLKRSGHNAVHIHYDIMVHSKIAKETKSLLAGILTYTRETHEITFDITTPFEHADFLANSLIAEVKQFIDTNKDILPVIQVREALRSVIEKSAYGIKVKDGVYFVSLDHINMVENIFEAYNKLDKFKVHVIPVVDDQIQRTRVLEGLLLMVESQLSYVYRKIDEILSIPFEERRAKDYIELESELDSLKSYVNKFTYFDVDLGYLLKKIGNAKAKLDTTSTKEQNEV